MPMAMAFVALPPGLGWSSMRLLLYSERLLIRGWVNTRLKSPRRSFVALLEVHSGAWLRAICRPGDVEVEDRDEAMNRGVCGVGRGAELE